MDTTTLLLDAYDRVKTYVHQCLDGLTAEQLAWRPTPRSNSIGWTAWHLARVQDRQVAALASRPQVWIESEWYARFNRPNDPADTGNRETPEQVGAFQSPPAQVLVEYYDAVHARTLEYLHQLTDAELERVLDETRFNPPPTVAVRLVSIMADDVLHSGEMSYVRGMVESRNWYPA